MGLVRYLAISVQPRKKANAFPDLSDFSPKGIAKLAKIIGFTLLESIYSFNN